MAEKKNEEKISLRRDRMDFPHVDDHGSFFKDAGYFFKDALRYYYFLLSESPQEQREEDYRRALLQGSADVAYGRLMLLGPAGVGKTCFKRGLMNLPFDNKTDSTILANVQSVKPVKPVTREWMTQSDGVRGWCEISEEDEIEELAQLMVLVGTIPKGSIRSTSHSTSQSRSMSFNLQSLQQLMESEIISKAMIRADSIKKCDVHALKCQPFFNLWDCGGQPVFLEVLPIFLTSHTMFLLVFNATKDLNEPWESVNHIRGREFLEGKVNMSTQEMIERWIALIYSHLFDKNKNSGYPRVIPIGTRGDELKRCGKDPQKVLKKLEDSMKSIPVSHHVLKRPIIIDNTTSGKGVEEDPGYQMVRKAMFDMTSSQLMRKKTPIAWILFRKLLQLAQRSQGFNIISFNDAIAIGSLAKVQQDQMLSVLEFYHELGVLLYYRCIKGLHEKIILSPQWFVECLGKILTLPGAGEERFEDKKEWELFRNKGILVKKLYDEVWGKCEGITPEELIDLFVYFQLAVEVTTDEYFNNVAKQLFVPAVLPYSSVPAVIENSAIKVAPLHITFNSGFPIPGFFTRLTTTMLKPKDDAHPQLALYFNDGIYHNQVTYRMKSLPSHFVTFTERNNVVEIDFSCYLMRPLTDIQKCTLNLKSLTQASCTDVATGLQSLHPNITHTISLVTLRVVCQAEQCQGKPVHYLTSDPPYRENINGSIHTVVVCEKDEKKPRDVTIEEAYWYKGIILPVDTSFERKHLSPVSSSATHSTIATMKEVSQSKLLPHTKDENILYGSEKQRQVSSGVSIVSSSNAPMKQISTSQVNITLNDTDTTTLQPVIPATIQSQSNEEEMKSVNNNFAATITIKATEKPVVSEIQVYHVYCQLREASNEWNAIGRELGISLNDREEMKKKSELSDDRLEMVLDKWKKSECCEVSWDKIIDKLLNLKLKNVATKVRRYLLEDKEAVRMYAWKEDEPTPAN